MPPINASTDNRSKQRKTYLHNVTAIAANCFRPEEWLLKFLALQLSTDSGNSSAGGAAFLTGHHVTAVLQPIVFCFIQEYVLCSKCGSPETLLYVEGKKRDKVSRLQCHSCGRSSRSAGQNAKMLNLFAAQPMRPYLHPFGRIYPCSYHRYKALLRKQDLLSHLYLLSRIERFLIQELLVSNVCS